MLTYVLLFAAAVYRPCIAQQDPLYSMYMFDKLLINPAFAGSSNWVVGTIKYREQARSFEGHPVTQTFNFHGPIQRKHLGLGLKVINDKLALQSRIFASAFLSYHLTLAGGRLSAGFEAGMMKRSTRFDELILTHAGDRAIPQGAVSDLIPDMGAGLYYQKKQFYLGFSAAHLLPRSAYDRSDPIEPPARHLYLLCGNVFTIKRDWTIEPSGLLKYFPGAGPQFDLNVMGYYDDKIGAGVQYRNSEALVAILRVEVLSGLRIAYSYDTSIGSKRSFAHGAHELILSYGVKLAPPPARKEVHPRYYF